MTPAAAASRSRQAAWRARGHRDEPAPGSVAGPARNRTRPGGLRSGPDSRRANEGLVRPEPERSVTTNQILLGVGLILALAVGSPVIASRLRIPALIILLPAGFIAGAITTDVNPQDLLGAAFQPLVSLAVAVILYDAGMSLDLRKLRGHTRRVVIRLIAIGVPVAMVLAAVFAGLLLRMSSKAALMLGAILVVSGPTVVGPLLVFIRPTERLQRVLSWEGSLIDPVGGILGAVVFHAVVASTREGFGYQLGQFLAGIGVGLAGGVAGTALLWLLLRRLRLGEVLGTTAQLAAVVAVAAGCDMIREDSGLISAIVMGLAMANLRGFDVPAAALLRDPGAADHRRALHRHFGHRHPGVAAPSRAASAGADRCPGRARPAACGPAGDGPDRPDDGGAPVHRVDGPARHHRGGHRIDVLRRARCPAHPGRIQDPAGHIPCHRCHRGAIRPDGRAGGQAGRRHAPGSHPAAIGRRRGLGRGPGTSPAVAGP